MTVVRLTAILTCRNAAPTLGRLLDHMAAMGADVVVVDHGSTDGTREIARSRRGTPVVELLDQPFDGVFDLTRQLILKRDLVRSAGRGWIIHADADEFLESPDGSPLAEHVGRLGDGAVIAWGVREFVFLPVTEEEVHAPDTFPETMRRYVRIEERDPKQRLFRADAPMDLWMATGGHTITLDAALLAPERLTLRHYPGLSLDHLRAQYLSRVFARSDLAKRWHGNRMAATAFDVAPPPPELLLDADRDGLVPGAGHGVLPFLQVRRASCASAGHVPADLRLVGPDEALLGEVAGRIADLFPGIRMDATAAPLPAVAASGTPVLQLLRHPEDGVEDAADAEAIRTVGADWTRRVASTRQTALAPGILYRELRLEDVAEDADLLPRTVRRLLLRELTPGPVPFLPVWAAPKGHHRSTPILRAIAWPLARDLGYV